MIKQLKKFTVQVLTGANVATIIVMLLVGYSDRLNPTDHPVLSTVGMTFPFFLLANMAFLFFWLLFKWTRVWLPVVGFLLAYVPISIYMPMNAAKEDGGKMLKVVSYNVCGYGGNFKYKDGFERVLAYLEAQDADIVCLQEDYDTWRRYVMQKYSTVYPYNDTLCLKVTKSYSNGLGIHSRFPIVKREQIEYKSEANGSVAYYLKMGSDTLLVVNNHLESTHLTIKDRAQYKHLIKGEMGSDTLREESMLLAGKLTRASVIRASAADAVHRYISEHSQYPTIVCGDFNDTPISYSRHIISRGLTDCFEKAGRGLGLTFRQKGFFFRIDHIFCSQDFEPVRCEVDAETDISDHYPMLCWLKIKDK